MKPFLITGASGNTGRPLVDDLVSRGLPVRAMTRTPADFPEGVENALADFDDPAALEQALEGVGSAYLVTPSSEDAGRQQVRFAELAARAGVEHLVVLSQLAAEKDSPVRFLRYHAEVEEKVADLGIDFTFLRPNLFFQGLFAFADPIREQGQFFAPIGEARVSAVDVRDVAEVAGVCLAEPAHRNAAYTLTGPAAVTHDELADALSDALHKDVTFVDVPPADFKGALDGVLPPWQVDGLLEDYAHYAAGEATEISPAVLELTAHFPRSAADFARDYAEVFTTARS